MYCTNILGLNLYSLYNKKNAWTDNFMRTNILSFHVEKYDLFQSLHYAYIYKPNFIFSERFACEQTLVANKNTMF